MDINKAQFIKKLWGSETIFAREPEYAGKILTLYKGFQSSLHYHKNKTETFFCLLGEVEIEFRNKNSKSFYVVLKTGESIKVKKGVLHRFRTSKEVSYLIEVSTEDKDSDNFRIEKSCKTRGKHAKKSNRQA